MRIEYKTLKKLRKAFGSFEIGNSGVKGMYLRFGYWQQVELEDLKKILPLHLHIYEVWDEDEDCGYLYYYNIEIGSTDLILRDFR